MVLISHRHKFIYLKNIKVAGTSVEAFFEKYCVAPEQNHRMAPGTDEVVTKYGIIGYRGNNPEGCKWVNHMSAYKIKENIGEKTFNSYFKFCIERNPWAKMVSLYHDMVTQYSFSEFCKKYTALNAQRYHIGGKSICNFIIRYEHLENDIIEVCKRLGITDYDIKDLPKYKSGNRPKRHYREYYDAQTKLLVYNKHKYEIDYFNYKF